MATLNIEIDATIPANASAEVLIREDVGDTGSFDNYAVTTVNDGTNTYSLSGFDGSVGNAIRARLILSTSSITDSAATINRISV